MREFITIVERTSVISLDQITPKFLWAAVPKADHDIQTNAWIGRAFHAVNGRLNRRIIEDVTIELGKVKSELKVWIASPTPLMRGLSKAPVENMSLGKHWTDYRYTAISHGSYILSANIRSDQIDWLGTVMRRISWIKEREFTVLNGITIDYTLEHDRIIIGDGRGTT